MNIRILLLFFAVLSVAGCSLVPVERYIHEPTSEIPDYLFTHQALPTKFIPAPGEVLLVPDFTAFTADFAVQNSHLLVFSKGEKRILVESAVLEVPEKNVVQTLTLNVSTQPEKLEKGDGVWVAYVDLFVDDGGPEDNCDFAKIHGAKSMTLVVRWRDGDRTIESRFLLQLEVRKEIAWVT